MVRREGLPCAVVAAGDLQLDCGRVQLEPAELPRGHVDDPVWGEPRRDVFVTGYGDEADGQVSRPDGFGEGGGGDAGEGAVEGGGEFVEGQGAGCGAQGAVKSWNEQVRARLPGRGLGWRGIVRRWRERDRV